MEMPKEEKREVPSYMVSFGDMITLLLTFFILLVALADRQQAGLVGAGQGPIIPHMMSKGRPGIMNGRLVQHRQQHKRDMWWIPSQEGDPEDLERVRTKLDRELQVRFRPADASVTYEKDRIILRLPARLQVDQTSMGRLTPEVAQVLDAVADAVRLHPERLVRVTADVPPLGRLDLELLESGQQARAVYEHLAARGVSVERMGIWGWGASRAQASNGPGAAANRGVTVEILE